MPYKDEYHPKIKADLKKLDKPVVREIFDTHIDKILLDPHNTGEGLHGSLAGIWSHHFTQNKVGYRIAPLWPIPHHGKLVPSFMMSIYS